MRKTIVFPALVALVVSLSSVGILSYWNNNGKTVKIEHINTVPSQSAAYSLNESGNLNTLDFHEPAQKVLNAVVHIKSTQVLRSGRNFQSRKPTDPFKDFFGDDFQQFFGPQFHFNRPRGNRNETPTKTGTGSGVIISNDGYIVTNNHVISEADDIEVTLHDNRTYKAAVIGVDPSTDLALIQIKESGLPTVPFINSDNVRVGEWVLAVGNPMGLNSTVTTGIISAKGRNINILKDKYAVENFIQTDAAINPGNSGGALVNLQGGLVGINTAIASPTGTFAGYGFAIPANIVNKVVEDLLEYGIVQRGVLGVMIRSIDGNLAKEKNLDLTSGVYVDSLLENSAAKNGGVRVGDVILKVNEVLVNTSSELQGAIAQHRPGEKVMLNIRRKDKELELEVTLNNRDGNTSLSNKDVPEVIKVMGAEFEDLDKRSAKKLGISGGVKVKRLFTGKLKKHTDMRDGFIITKVNNQTVKSLDEMNGILEKKDGAIVLQGIYEDIPGQYYYAFGL